mmetsp:Transcript_11312/g.7831  ORF Transcript_11312/g.7831 Transcript_11312/m.7831 type:complete len:213 (+) Transcript_11312:290-928(+)
MVKRVVPHKKKVISILVLCIIVLIGKLHFMYSKKFIFMFFFWSWAANVVTTYALGVLLTVVWIGPGLTLYRRFKWYFYIMAFSYIMMIPFAFTYKYGAYCDETIIYPNVMALLPLAYLTLALFVFYLDRNKYFCDWTAHEKVPLSNAEDYTNQDLFEKQMKQFLGTTNIVLVMQIVLFIVGKTAHDNEWVACALNGRKWLFLSPWATIFGIF